MDLDPDTIFAELGRGDALVITKNMDPGQEAKLTKWRLLPDELLAPIISCQGKWAKKKIMYMIFYTLILDYIDDFARILRHIPRGRLSHKQFEKYAKFTLKYERCEQYWEVLMNNGWEGCKEPEWLLYALKSYSRRGLVGWLLERGRAQNIPFGAREFTRTSIQHGRLFYYRVSPEACILDVAILSDDIGLVQMATLLRAGARFGAPALAHDYLYMKHTSAKFVYAKRVHVYQNLLAIKGYPLPKELTRMIADMIVTK